MDESVSWLFITTPGNLDAPFLLIVALWNRGATETRGADKTRCNLHHHAYLTHVRRFRYTTLFLGLSRSFGSRSPVTPFFVNSGRLSRLDSRTKYCLPRRSIWETPPVLLSRTFSVVIIGPTGRIGPKAQDTAPTPRGCMAKGSRCSSAAAAEAGPMRPLVWPNRSEETLLLHVTNRSAQWVAAFVQVNHRIPTKSSAPPTGSAPRPTTPSPPQGIPWPRLSLLFGRCSRTGADAADGGGLIAKSFRDVFSGTVSPLKNQGQEGQKMMLGPIRPWRPGSRRPLPCT